MEGVKSYEAKVHGAVTALAFSPYEWCGSLLAVGTMSRVTVFCCVFPEEDPSLEDMDIELLRDFHHGHRVIALSWSPQTSLKQLPKELKFATAGSDMKIRYFFSDLKNDDQVVLIEGHKDQINDVAIEFDSGKEIASVSDDYTCCVWSTDGDLKVRFSLTSPGMSVSWHRSEPGKLMVAEKKGLLRFYNIVQQQPFMSFDCNLIPLMSAQWCPTNSLVIGAIAGTDWFMWKTSTSSRPSEHRTVHTEGANLLAFSLVNQNVFATRSSRGSHVKVINQHITQPIFVTELAVGRGLSWHFKIQILAAGGDGKVHMWKINST